MTIATVWPGPADVDEQTRPRTDRQSSPCPAEGLTSASVPILSSPPVAAGTDQRQPSQSGGVTNEPSQ
jgi:hypothetical protein